MKNKITKKHKAMLSQTSALVKVKSEIEPNSVEHTSPEIFDETLKTLRRR